MSRSVLIHAGTHKTGTTSLQTLFTRHRAELADRGILYPVTGVWSGGSEGESHTNIAWELMGHVLFDPESGTLDDLVDEIVASPCRNALISSEEFSCFFVHPEFLCQLRDRLLDAGLTPYIALSFRDVDDYARSLYVTLASLAYEPTYAEFQEMVAVDGEVTFRKNTYCFDYDRLVRTFAEIFGAEAITCIDYDPTDAVAPFLKALDWFFEGALDGADADLRSNTTMSRVEELRRRVTVRQERIDTLEVQVEELEAEVARLQWELQGVNVTLDWFKNALAASQNTLPRRTVRRLRSAVPRRSPD